MTNKTLLLIITGFLGGLVGGLFGLGGGIVIIPMLVLLLRLDQRTAQGTCLLIVIPTATINALVYTYHGNIDFGVLPWLVLGALFGTTVGANLAQQIPMHILRRIFALALLTIAGVMLLT